MTSSGPLISALLTTPDCFATLRWTIARLRAQTVRDRIEVVIVAPSFARLALDPEELAGFAGYRVVELGLFRSVAQTRAAGVRAASAPLVAFCEDHCLPDPDWAEALIEAHRGAWAAVAPAVRNGNPGNLLSWAIFLVEYGPWIEPIAAGDADHLPGNNSCYKREVLLSYGDQLETMLETESILHWDLRATGLRLLVEPKARTAHYNYAIWRTWFYPQYHTGRQFAASRAMNWRRARRLLYAAGSPLIPAVRFQRIVRDRLRRGLGDCPLFRSLPLLFLGLSTGAAGELMGYLFGAGDSTEKLIDVEFHRDRHILPRDRQALEAELVSSPRAEPAAVPCVG